MKSWIYYIVVQLDRAWDWVVAHWKVALSVFVLLVAAVAPYWGSWLVDNIDLLAYVVGGVFAAWKAGKAGMVMEVADIMIDVNERLKELPMAPNEADQNWDADETLQKRIKHAVKCRSKLANTELWLKDRVYQVREHNSQVAAIHAQVDVANEAVDALFEGAEGEEPEPVLHS